MKVEEIFIAVLAIIFLIPSVSFAENGNGERIYLNRCAMCHGIDIKGTGLLANKSIPPTPDLTTPAFKNRLLDYPGVIVSSIILRPNGDLIPKTLRENGVKLPAFTWAVKDFRDLNEYLTGAISKSK
ncbi:cytochrome c [Bosea sp. OK403]|uniref:c-type cytochrome n=1 Tax=Bosea sp. OK403 TaxID=1855286 RepID=UPI000B87729F|nr:cytochrome c [Bosea sp. OK403]